jgi:hypothetical protein
LRAPKRGALLVVGLLLAAGLIVLLGIFLREGVATVALELARLVARLESSADFASYREGLDRIFGARPAFERVFRDVLLVPRVSAGERPPLERRAYLLSPVGVAPQSELSAVELRWFDAHETDKERSLWARLCPETDGERTGDRPGPADETRETPPLPLEPARRLEDGSRAAEVSPVPPPPRAALAWIRIRIGSGDAVEDEGWFRASEPVVEKREALDRSRFALLRLCRQGRMSTSQADLLLAVLLRARGFDLAAARLLELLRAEGRSSAAAEALLRAIYTSLRRPEGLPREPARREDAASWKS